MSSIFQPNNPLKIPRSSPTSHHTHRGHGRNHHPASRMQPITWISVSNRQISLLALLVALFGGLHTVFLLSSVPATAVDDAGWKPEQGDALANAPPPRVLDNNDAMRLSNNSTHAIPRILIFTHYRDLLLQAEQQNALTDEEEIVLAANIRRVIDLHPKGDTVVRFLTDEQCIESLQRNFPSLVAHFIHETQGMFKADICRGSALYETGGIYLDVDIGVRKDLWLDLRNETEFVTSRVHMQSHYPKHFFQAILGAAPQSPIIYKYLELFEDHYTGKERVEKGPLGVILLRRAWDRVFDGTKGEPVSELYQEVLYNKKLFPNLHPAPTWGSRRACHFVVVAAANYPEHSEISLNGKDYHIPLYSRIAGSRMCPINATSADRQSKNGNRAVKKG
jgi:hypothetical protein